MYEQVLAVANRRSRWAQMRIGRRMATVEGGFLCQLCTYAYVIAVILLAMLGFYVLLTTLAQVLMGIGRGFYSFHHHHHHSDQQYDIGYDPMALSSHETNTTRQTI